MRLLFVAPFLPDVHAVHGGGVYLGTLSRALSRHAELALVAQVRPEDVPRLGTGELPFQRHWTTPLQERPAGAGRRRHRLRMLVRWGLRGLPLLAAKHCDGRFPGQIRAAIAAFRPDAALVELAQMAQYLPCFGELPTIFTDHESGMPANAHTDLGAWADRRDRRLWRRYVHRFYPRARLLQAVTPEDAAALQRELGIAVETRAPTLDVPRMPVAPERAPPRALFLGDYSHYPNPEAASVIVREVLPRLRAAVPDVELWLAGPNAQRLNGISSAPGVRVVGFAPDLKSLFGDVRLLLAPLYSGSGFRMKSLSALAHGLPVVTNALGARGCSAPAPGRIVTESIGALADAALELLRAPQRAATAGRAAHAWAQQHLSPEVVARAQLARIEQLLGR